MYELSLRINNRFQLTTDAFAAYERAVDRVWGSEVDYGQVVKEYTNPEEGQRRYSPPRIIRVTKKIVRGNPDWSAISTSHIERQNLPSECRCEGSPD
jgi:hypothetical protein